MTEYRKYAEWVGLNGPRPSDVELADYLQADLDNKDGEIDAVDAAVIREAIASLRERGNEERLRCTICGFIIDRRFAATKPTADYTMAGRQSR